MRSKLLTVAIAFGLMAGVAATLSPAKAETAIDNKGISAAALGLASGPTTSAGEFRAKAAGLGGPYLAAGAAQVANLTGH